jgi:ketosteroid isomerase-like protein
MQKLNHMKTIEQTDQLKSQQIDQIKSEIRKVVDSIFAKSEMLDADAISQYYSPHLVVVRDTQIFDYLTWKKAWADFMNYTSTFKWKTAHWECIIIAKDLAISTLVGKMEYIMKSGEKTTIDPIGWAHVWKEVDGQWKVIYENYSGIHVTKKAEKK